MSVIRGTTSLLHGSKIFCSLGKVSVPLLQDCVQTLMIWLVCISVTNALIYHRYGHAEAKRVKRFSNVLGTIEE